MRAPEPRTLATQVRGLRLCRRSPSPRRRRRTAASISEKRAAFRRSHARAAPPAARAGRRETVVDRAFGAVGRRDAARLQLPALAVVAVGDNEVAKIGAADI